MNLEDIARQSGVSRSTVSRVINNEKYVSEAVRVRVLAVIEREQFQPNAAARTLVTRHSNIIGTTVPQTANVFFGDNSYYPMLLQGIAETVNRENYAMLLWLADAHETRETFANRVFKHRQSDGVIVTSIVGNDPLFNYLVQHNRRFVMVETPPRMADRVSFVTVDNVGAAESIVQHLYDIGKRRIATVTGSPAIQDAVDRLEGYKNRLSKLGLPIDPNLIVYGGFHRSEGYEGMKQLLDFKPDAVFAGGDTIAMGVLDVLHEVGLCVPEDVAVVGFDDLDVATRANLTTICHSVQLVGSTAAQLLIDLVEGRLEHPQHIIIPTELVIRGSTVRV